MAQPIKASEVDAEKIEWRWEERIPQGMIAVVAGRRDQGKGLFAAHVAAAVSRTGEHVIYSAAEDHFGLMTRPRLEAAGADLENIDLWRFKLPEAELELAELVIANDTGLIIMDPFGRHLSHGVSRFGDNIEKVLTPLTKLVEDTGASAIIVEHALKNVPKSGELLDCIGGGSSGLPAAARVAFVLGKDPEDGDKRILCPAKFNIDTWPDSMQFELDVAEVELTTKSGEVFTDEAPFLTLDGTLEAFDGMRLLQTKNKPGTKGRPSDKRSSAAEWLTTILAEEGAMTLKALEEAGKQVKTSRRTLQRAGADMGIVKIGNSRNIVWDLPDDVKTQMGIPVQRSAIRSLAETETEDDENAGPQKASNIEVTDEALAELLNGKKGGGKNE